MLAVAAALAVLGVLSAAGILAVRRAGPVLTGLEAVAYGGPLGAVIGTLLILVLARVVGLTTATVVVANVAVAGLVVGVLYRPPTGAWRTGTGPGGRVRRFLATPGAWIPIAVLGLVLVRWTVFWSGAVAYTDAGMEANHVNIYGDLPVHMGNAAAFAYGDNFPPQHPRFAGHPLSYHHLSDLSAAALIPMGLDPSAALTVHSLVFSVFTALAVYAFALRLTNDVVKASIAFLLFVLGGSLGWLAMLPQLAASPDPLAQPLWDFGLVGQQGYRWQNMFYGFLMPQRAYLYGIPLTLLSMTLVLVGNRLASSMALMVAGAVLGLLPLAHLGSMLAMALVTPFLVLLFPTWRWIYFFAAWILVALPQLFLQQGGGPGALSFMRIHLGWVMGDVAWPIFWLKQVGLFLPLVIVALALPRLLPRDSYRLLAAFMTIFVIANVLVFQPWDWDNHKVLVYWFLATCILVASLLVWAWRRYGLAVRGLITVALVTMVLSGVLEDANQLLGHDTHGLFNTEEIALAAQVRDETPPDAVFAAGTQNNHPIPALAGRQVLMGYWGWLFAEGLPWQEREADVLEIYALTDEGERLLDSYAVDYVVIGPGELDNMDANLDAYRSRYPSVISTANYDVFAIEP